MSNAILYYAWGSAMMAITGSLINAFEYFIAAYEHNKDIKLMCLKSTKSAIELMISVMKNRYDLSGLDGFEKNIMPVSWKDLIRTEFDNLLVLDFVTISKTRGFIRAKNLIVISEKHTEDPEYFYRKDLYNVTYYGEMPFHYKDIDYRMKMLFNRYKPLKKVKEGIYINSPQTNNATFKYDTKFLKELNLPKKPVILKSCDHLDNLFEQFDTYVYYHSNRWFDPHPRLFVECAFYNKDIYYINNYGIKDGSYYRYKDVKENGVKDRTLNRDDEIIRMLANV
jgi:hypothetical protein